MYEIHEFASIFPAQTKEERADLLESISSEGQLVPIILYQGKVLDGKHRYEICQELGLVPNTQEHEGTDESALNLVMAANMARRHLNGVQRAVVALSFKDHWARLAKDRMAVVGSANLGVTPPISAQEPKTGPIDATAKAKEAGGVGGRSLSVVEEARTMPDLWERVEKGEFSQVKEVRAAIAAAAPPRAAEDFTPYKVLPFGIDTLKEIQDNASQSKNRAEKLLPLLRKFTARDERWTARFLSELDKAEGLQEESHKALLGAFAELRSEINGTAARVA